VVKRDRDQGRDSVVKKDRDRGIRSIIKIVEIVRGQKKMIRGDQMID
jgi:hypothetical protein